VYRPVFELSAFDTMPHPEKVRVLIALLEALALADLIYLRANPKTPRLYESGVVYVREPDDRDNWQDIPRTIALRNGDCEDLCAWRVAELRAAGELAEFELRHFLIGHATVYHVLVRHADGGIEDPSRALGMNADAQA
jgi:hypothetical protein